MASKVLAAILTPLVKTVHAATKTSNTGSGWGPYGWTNNFDEALSKARREKKPVMVVIQKKECPHCTNLAKKVSSSGKMVSNSKNFVMVNMHWDEVPHERAFAPDGRYIPRVLFFHPDGSPMTEVKNYESGTFKYAYNEVTDLLEGMAKARKIFYGR